MIESRVGVGFVLALCASGVFAADPVGKIASVQNQVETRRSGSAEWAPSTASLPLFELDRVRTGPASRAAILYSDQTLQRINEKSEVEILPPGGGNPGVLRVISGTHYFSSRRPKDYSRIETPTVTAAIRGTEFVVEVGEGGVTTITMLEGVVDASNAMGGLTVSAGEQAFVEPGKAPIKRIVLRPRDAVAWSLYYPRVMGSGDESRLKALGADGESLARAAAMLSSGQVDGARPLIQGVRERQPKEPLALALASVIELAADRTDEAVKLASEAFAADPASAAAALAFSFAAQGKYDIRKARSMAETAARLAPENSEALARVAELRMAEGDISGAKYPAGQAVRRDPNSARAHTVLGFIELAEFKSDDAAQSFDKAVAADPAFPMARLGSGIAAIRQGNFGGGREQMQTAASLDPGDSLVRSYLAKAYYEERREMEASKELNAAKELDPSDPTPHLYDAILKQTYNRPVEALASLQRSMELNDRRGVYRSRLLLDQDMAVRSADLARIYNDLGFEELGMVSARRSADADQSNFSSHLFLAGNYRNLPGFAPAFLSESLQARIYQPVNVNAVRPDAVNQGVSYNEYTSLIEQPGLRYYVGATYGWTDTDLSGLYPSGSLCPNFTGTTVGPCEDILQLNGSTPHGADATVTFNQDRFAGSVSFSNVEEDGFRANNDTSTDVKRGFFAFAPTLHDHFQVSFIDGHRETGDLPLRARPGIMGFERISTDLTNIGVSYRRTLSSASDLVFSAIHSDTEQTAEFPIFGISGTARLKGPQFEAQYVLRQERMTWIAGLGYFDGVQELVGSPGLREDDTFSNGYVYVKFRNLGPLEFTAGASYEEVSAPVGLLPPRDYGMIPDAISFKESKANPKLGATLYLGEKTILRGAVYYRLSPAIGRLQTIEPTQVAGFNQFFADPGGTLSLNYGLGIDQTFTGNLFGGLSVMRRSLDIPEPGCDTPDPLIRCAGLQATRTEERHSDDWLGSAYLNGTLGKRVALSAEYAYEQRDFDYTQVTQTGAFEEYARTERLRPEARVFFPNGLHASVRGTRYSQKVDQFDPFGVTPRTQENSDFWIGDVQLGYRLPNRWGAVVLDALNVTDRAFLFYRSSIEERVVPARTIMLSLRFNSN